MTKLTRFIKTILTPIALCLTLAIAGPVMAKKNHHQKHDGMRQILSELSLTDTQKQDIRQILKQTREDRSLFSSDEKSLKKELRSLVRTTEWDQTAIEDAIKQRQDLIQEKSLQRARNKNQVWNLLTNTQQAECIALIDTRKADSKIRKAKDVKGNKKDTRKGNRLKRLDLTKAQIAAVKDIRNVAKTTGEETKTRLKTFKQAERVLVHSSNFSAESWQTLSNEYKSDFLTMAVIKAKTKHDIWNRLTPEQQVQAGKKYR